MAKNNNVKDFAKDIADAIRAKENSVAKINPQDFSARIAALSVGGSPKFAELVSGTLTTIEESDLKDVTTIRDSVFADLGLTSVEIPSNVTTIGDSAFANNSISSLTLNEGVTTIGDSAFANNSITTLEIPSSVTTIGDSAFGGTQITEINMDGKSNPPSVTSTTFPSTLSAIYVAYRDYDTYLTKWSDYADKIVRLPAIPSTITVIVNDYTGALVSGASVTISGNGQTYTGTTDVVGTFTQGDLQPATYTISVADMEGFKTPASSEVVVEEDTQNSVTVTYLEKPAQTPFAEATWKEISDIANEISRNNMTSAEVEETYGWKLGDSKSETMSDGETIELQIIGFCHDKLANGIGYAGITLQTVDCLSGSYRMLLTSGVSYEWDSCDMRLTTLPNIKSMFTQELHTNIVSVNKISDYDITEDELFLLSEQEVFGIKGSYSSESTIDEGPLYEYWAEHNTKEDRIKSNTWFLRSRGSSGCCYVTSHGTCDSDGAYYSKGLSFALCLGSFDRDPSKKAFSEQTPAEISEISAAIAAKNMTSKQIGETYGWYLGDTTTIPLTTGENITVRIIGFNHDNLSDGSGKAGVTLQMVDTLKTAYSLNTPDSAKGGWGASQMKTTTIPSIKATLPQEWQDVIKLVDKKYANGTGSGYTETLTSSDDLFLLSAIELYGDRYTDTTAQAYNTEGSIYEYWKSNFALGYRKKKYDSDGDGTPETTRDWWLRSLANDYDPYWRLVKKTGGIDLTVPRFTRGVSFAFCIGSAADYVSEGGGSGEDTPTFSRTFSENTWEQISAVSEQISANNMTSAQVASTYGWNLGDIKSDTLSTGEVIEVRIIGFNHDDLGDYSGKAGITFDMTHCLATSYKMNSTATNSGGWGASEMRKTHLPAIKETLPQELQSVIKKVWKSGYQCELFLLSAYEVFGNTDYANADGTRYVYWKTNNTKEARIKKYSSNANNVLDQAAYWWLRSPRKNNSTQFCYGQFNGDQMATEANVSYVKTSFAFCV